MLSPNHQGGFMSIVRLALALIVILWASDSYAQTYRASSTNNGTGTAITATVPTGTSAGDIVLVFIQLNNSTGTCADNNGGTAFAEDLEVGGTSMAICLYSRRITGSEPSPYAFTANASTDWRASAVAISSPHASIIYDAGPTNNCGASSTTATATGLTSSSSNALFAVFYGADTTSLTWSNKPGSYTERIDAGGVDRPHWIGTKNAAAGVEGDQTITMSSSAAKCGVMVAIESPVAASVRPRGFIMLP
jgi:hypothetical protein